MPASEDESQRQEVSRLLADWSKEDPAARDALVAIVYKELRRLAHHYMQGERANHTLQTTALVHEAYLRLTDLTRMQWRDRAHFFAMAATLMRRILVDHARDRARDKRGGGVVFTTLQDERVATPPGIDAVALEPDGRPACLSGMCGSDGVLRQQVEALLASHEQAGTFLERPAAALISSSPDELIGRTLDTYRIVSRLGAGGMGEVYKAHDSKLGREVALKLLPHDVDADRLRRFHAEA